ncbi:MAG: Abi family protein [Clostridia bacterium]|nr:Abi family protein [Clostridia bacterium]MDD4386488.1 Abi family protein [Clostridia bacterium]
MGGEDTVDKEFKTYDIQVEILKSRDISIKDDLLAIGVLEKENYYNLINGYKDLFLDISSSEEKYINGTEFNEIVSLFEFDRELKVIFFFVNDYTRSKADFIKYIYGN